MIQLHYISIALFLLGAILTGSAGFTAKIAYEKWQEANAIVSYQYSYFGNIIESNISTDTEETKSFLNNLDLSKRSADKYLKKFFEEDKLQKARKLNDYSFRIFRDMWFIQNKWFQKNGRYFQGKDTVIPPPSLGKNGKVDYGFGLTDQVENWSDIGYFDEYAPITIRSDVYNGPKGHGYIVSVKFKLENNIWIMRMHHGPEERGKSFVWKTEN